MTLEITQHVQDRLVTLVRQVAREEILPHFRNLTADSISTKTSETDLVTVADQASEKRISAGISDVLPDATIIGEEGVADDPGMLDLIGQSDLVAIIDPIDGTWNFAMGLPLFGVMISIVSRGKTVFGLLYDPLSDAWVTARAGHGAHFASGQGATRRLQIDTADRRRSGLVPLFLYPKDVQRKLAPKLVEFDRIMSLRCSCHEYWLLAHGGVDFALSGLLKPWDHAAGEFIFREAGGFTAMLDDASPYNAAMTEGQLLAARNERDWHTLRDAFDGVFTTI